MSFDWYRRAHESIAQGSLTNSKRVECLIKGVSPTHATHGEGPYLYCTDKRKYLDFICALGTNFLGYANPYIQSAVNDQMKKGWLFSVGSTLEVECAELVKDRFQFVEKVRFVKTGTEACMAAIRIARAHTGRKEVLSHGYHGWSDGFVGLTPPALGCAVDSELKPLTTIDQVTDKTAAVILEPVITDWSKERIEFLSQLQAKCQETGTLVIFDEIITGFRWPKMCFSIWAGLKPDILLLGKACAAGMPLGIVGLGRGIGDEKEWFVSGSYCGEMLSLAALKKTCELLTNKYDVNELWRIGGYFLEEFNAIWPEKLRIDGYPTRGVFAGDINVKALFFQEAHKAGILFGPSWFFNFPLMNHKDAVMTSCRDILLRIRMNQVKLEGEMPASPFAERMRKSE